MGTSDDGGVGSMNTIGSYRGSYTGGYFQQKLSEKSNILESICSEEGWLIEEEDLGFSLWEGCMKSSIGLPF